MDNYYKDSTGTVYAYDAEQVAMGLADDKTAMTADEVEAHVNPPKTAEQLKLIRAAEIKFRLLEIDAESVRPMRAKLAGMASEYDTSRLATLDTEAAALRIELSKL